MSDIQNIVDVSFSQKAFFIRDLLKHDIDNLGLEGKYVRLHSPKVFNYKAEEGDSSRIRVEATLTISLGAQDEEINNDDDIEMVTYIVIEATSFYTIQDKYSPDDFDYLERILISQTNVQVTDIANTILGNSELKGDKLPYDLPQEQ